MDHKTLGIRIREARKSQKMTQEALAEKIGIGTVYLSELERSLKTPSLEIFVRIVEALDVSADYLLRDEVEAGKIYVFDDITKKMEGFTPQQRKLVSDIVDTCLKNLR